MSRERDKFSLLSANRLTEVRLKLFPSQDEAGKACGVSRVMWGQYERGDAAPGAAVLEKLAAAGADVQYILTGRHGAPAMTEDQERAGYVVEVLSPSEKKLLDAARASGALAKVNMTISGTANQVVGINEGDIHVGEAGSRPGGKRKR